MLLSQACYAEGHPGPVLFVLTSPYRASLEDWVHGENNISKNISSIALQEEMFPIAKQPKSVLLCLCCIDLTT